MRRRSGEILGREAPADADLVCAVPDSSNTAALGYAQATGMPFELALIRNHYVGRTFISPAQKVRDMSVRIKFNPVARGPGRQAGRRGRRLDRARHDHAQAGQADPRRRRARGAPAHRLAAGDQSLLTTASTRRCGKELIASSHTVDEIATYLRVDSLAYLSLAGLLEAAGDGDRYCDACFTGNYPVSFADGERTRTCSTGTPPAPTSPSSRCRPADGD